MKITKFESQILQRMRCKVRYRTVMIIIFLVRYRTVRYGTFSFGPMFGGGPVITGRITTGSTMGQVEIATIS